MPYRMVHMDQVSQQESGEMVGSSGGQEEERIREVWSHNLEDEFKNICRIGN